MKLYSINLLGPREVDAITGDKIFPPMYRTVQNRQPIPEGTVQKRNSISAETIIAADGPGGSHKETQLISYVYLKAGPDATAVAAVSDRSATTTFYKWSGTAWGLIPIADATGTATAANITTLTDDTKTWGVNQWAGDTLEITDVTDSDKIYYVIITENTDEMLTFANTAFVPAALDTYKISYGDSLTNDTEDGIYYVCNALDFSNKTPSADPVTTDLFVVKHNASPSSTGTPPYGDPCCYSIDDGYNVNMFDGSRIILSNGKVWTGNWKNARCAEYHQGKMWVGGLVECDLTVGEDTPSGLLSENAVNLPTETTITTKTANTVISAGTVINIANATGDLSEDMAVTGVDGNVLTVVRGINNTTAENHDADAAINHYVAVVQRPYRIRWSKSFDWKTNFDGLGAGSFESPGAGYMDVPTVGTHTVVGMRSFRGRLYVLTTSDMFVVTGTTTAQYGLTQLFSTPSAIGQTMWASDLYLFWTDANGMHQFNGSQERNLTDKEMPVGFKALNVEKYDISGENELGRLPTGFINEKLKIYGVHFPYVSANVLGKVTWLYNYERESITTYTYTYPTHVEDITYVSDYHDNGTIWAGTSNKTSPTTAAAYGGKYSFEPVAVDPQDWGANPVSLVLETGDINFAAHNGLSYEDAVVIHRIDLYVVPDPDTSVTYKMDMVVDNATTAQQTVAIAGSSASPLDPITQPILAMMPLPALKTGSFFKFTFTEDTASARVELRKVDIFYDIRAIRGATR
jgi:hypothetical protein